MPRNRTTHPQDGPRILFFSGGTALRELSQALPSHTHRSVHIITPFDSGGSSASLRQAFSMPAPGDIRNRLMALADTTDRGNSAIFDLFAFRFPHTADKRLMDADFTEMASGTHPLVAKIAEPLGSVVRHLLMVFSEAMPPRFDLAGASVGNLILTAGYLEAGRRFAQVIYTFSNLVRVRGTVLPVAETNLHLAADLEDGTTILGQHRLTGKECTAPSSPIRQLRLTRSLDNDLPATCQADPAALRLIEAADLICFPMGSFFTSVVANLLPQGVGKAVAAATCPKIFIPNCAEDPESKGIPIARQAEIIIQTLEQDLNTPPPGPLLDAILLDDKTAYNLGSGLQDNALAKISILKEPLVTQQSTPLLDAHALARTLMNLTS